MYVPNEIPMKFVLDIADVVIEFESDEMGLKYANKMEYLDRIVTSMLETAHLCGYETITTELMDLMIKHVEDHEFLNNEGLIVHPKLVRLINDDHEMASKVKLVLSLS